MGEKNKTKPKQQAQNPTTILQKAHTFLQKDNSNITREWRIASKISFPWREEMTQWWKRWMLVYFLDLKPEVKYRWGCSKWTLNRKGGNTNSFHLNQLEIPSESTKKPWNPSSLHGGTPREFQEHINRLTKEEGEAGEQRGLRREQWWSALWDQGR